MHNDDIHSELGLYIHYPYCIAKCPYCDFNSHAPSSRDDEAYFHALLNDIEQAYREHPGTARTCFIGGGTPSLLPPHLLAQLLEHLWHKGYLAQDAEITLEANPGSIEISRFTAIHAAGVNRLSVGVQSFVDQSLQVLGRIHSSDQAARALEAAQQAGFSRLNIDLMYALPEQDESAAVQDLQRAVALGASHISWYHLTLEPNTRFYHQPPEHLPDDDHSVDIEAAGRAYLAAQGFERYEISAFAQPGQRCAHNLNYWTFGDYLGVGPGAHGKLHRNQQVVRQARRAQPAAWMREVAAGRAVAVEQAVPDAMLGFEFMLNALRLIDGVPRSLWTQQSGYGHDALADAWQHGVQLGLLSDDPDRYRCTEQGLVFLNDAQALFLPDKAD